MTTIADVARAARVSISTVSYVLSGKRTISPDTKERVTQAIADLNYSPHASARSLASRSTQVIGLQAPLRAGVDVHVVMEIVAGIARAARANRYNILLLTGDDSEALEHAARASAVDALVVMDVESTDPRIETVKNLPAPSVLIGLPSESGDAHCVDFDFEAAGRLAAARLAELGHKRVALFGAPQEVMERHTSYVDRLRQGFIGGCEEHGLSGSVHACPTSTDARATVDGIFAENPSMTGVLFHNEGALPHVAPRIIAGGRDVIAMCPEHLARTVPGLTDTIIVPAEDIGAAAARAALDLLAGTKRDRIELLPPRLGSTSAEA
ncbi:LacI family DNA-binding transcriptional regulator [Microbacterium amylolyticum]|uniref:DNA-binding LacI/PurR family transcriptional regulator n=1 Tax=Microbacterium amylolyticum TaxID=936337 RepID=A0ABS4ZJ53_9MICO|nr:LacI family DNA-binding transcriptional regulator [Microbacterium amylolyticum]MBP2437222.1 DNA-binding LacI/PurR family transcriptional regulator [Microbacterium amylolyticum]